MYLKEHGDSHKTKKQRSRIVYFWSTFIITINALTYGICDSNKLFFLPEMKWLWNFGFTILGFTLMTMQIPFKFYLTKEFLFILYDEFKNRGLSSKIEDLRAYSSGDRPHYSTLQVQKLREDLYQIVRMPYLKFSNKEYLTLTTVTYVLTVATMFFINAFIDLDTKLSLAQIHWEILSACCGFAEPIITYIIPGVYFYKMSI